MLLSRHSKTLPFQHFLVVSTLCCILLKECVRAEEEYSSCGLHLTVSSLQETAGRLELNWNDNCNDFPGTINLYDDDPRLAEDPQPLAFVNPRDHHYGFFLTTVEFGSPHLPGGWDETLSGPEHAASPGPHCLPFWIASHHKEEGFLEVDCLKIQPTWMEDLKGKIDKVPLSRTLIPGTHNSGSYPGPGSLLKGEALQRFVMTQDQNIWNQLVFGIRYFDLRIGFSAFEDDDANSTKSDELESNLDDKKFTINHDVVQVRRLVPVLRSIKKFIEKTSREIVIIDVHRLPVGFYLLNGKIRRDRHQMLIDLLYQELGHYAMEFESISRQYARLHIHLMNGPRFEEIWESGKRVILCYPERSISDSLSWLWPPLKQLWGNKQLPNELKTYIKRVMASDPPVTPQGNQLWAVMAQLTPTALDILFDPSNNLRKMADSINRNLTRWVDEEWKAKGNIIASDFFLGNNLIDIAVKMATSKTILP